MSQLSLLLSSLKERAVQIEQAIAQTLANHNVLLGQSAEVKNLLDMATVAAGAIAPTNPIVMGLEAIDHVVDAVAADEAAAPAVVSPE